MDKRCIIVTLVAVMASILFIVTQASADDITLSTLLPTGGGLWQISPDNPNDIYYDIGNVGIGTTAPDPMRLSVSGTPYISGDSRSILELIDVSSMAAGVGSRYHFWR